MSGRKPLALWVVEESRELLKLTVAIYACGARLVAESGYGDMDESGCLDV